MLDRLSPKPLHMQMEELIRKNLTSGEWAPGRVIPSENELSQKYGISRMTVRNVITKLVQEDLFERIPGKGTYVKESKIIARSLSYAGVREQLESMGYEVTTKLLSIEKRTVSEDTSNVFGLAAEAQFHVIQRLRFLKGVPLSIHTSYIPYDICPGLESTELETEQLCVILNNSFGLKKAKMTETLESVGASKKEAALLQVKYGYPLLLPGRQGFPGKRHAF